jgi:hypothetical protein
MHLGLLQQRILQPFPSINANRSHTRQQRTSPPGRSENLRDQKVCDTSGS